VHVARIGEEGVQFYPENLKNVITGGDVGVDSRIITKWIKLCRIWGVGMNNLFQSWGHWRPL
jgi:hypothetical protein